MRKRLLEKDFWKEIRDHLPDVHWQRIETGQTGGGIPDLNGCWKGREAWIELKVHPNKLTPMQDNWIRKRREARGIAIVAVRYPEAMILADGDNMGHFPMPFDWPAIHRFIFGAP